MGLLSLLFNKKTIAAVIIFIIVIVAIYVAAQPPIPSTKAKTGTTVTITLFNNIGIDQIKVINENTQEPFIFTRAMLPAQFNCSYGNTLTFIITLAKGYEWNGFWFSPQDIWCHGISTYGEVQMSASPNNPFGDVILNNEIVMYPYCIKMAASPTPSPSPTVSVIE